MNQDLKNEFIINSAADSYAVKNKTIVLPAERKALNSSKRDNATDLPPIYSAAELLADTTVELPRELVGGVLHKGLKGVLGSTSKARKTWMLLDLALSVASGKDWLKWKTSKGKVLVINFEIPLAFLRKRVRALAHAKGDCDTGDLDIWTLRGFSAPFSELIPRLIDKVKESKYDLIIIDPIYKGLGSGDENKAGDIGNLCNELERLAVQTEAAVVYAHHFSKGNQASKEAIDRFSGSGVFGRDADSLIVLTPHEKDNCYVVELILRNFKEQAPFVVEWKFPHMEIRSHLSSDKLKRKGGKSKEDHTESLLGVLQKKPLITAEWQKKVATDCGISKSTFYREIKRLEGNGLVKKSEKKGQQDKWTIA